MSGITHRYDFDRHLAVGERVEVLAMNPGFSAWAEEVTRTAGGYGSKTKKSVTDPKGMLLFGAASVMYGSDRAAAAELRYAWPLLIPKLKRAGVSVSYTAPNDAGWQYFRSVYLEHPQLVEELWEVAADLWCGMSLDMGMFPSPSGEFDWMHLDHVATAYADATWVGPASSVGIKRGKKTHRSRSTTGRPRLSEDVDSSGRNHGYQHTVMSARLPQTRMRLILGADRAAPSQDAKVGIEAVLKLRNRLGDRIRHFAYDRALQSHDDVTRLARAGILPLTKPGNVDAFDDWTKLRGSKLRPKKAIPFALRFDSDCYHSLAIDAGMLWDMEDRGGDLYYGKTAEHRNIRRVRRPDGTYDFEIDLRLACRRTNDHYFTWSLTGTTERLHKKPLRLAAHLRPFSIADWEVTGPALTIRQNAESNFEYLKDYMGLGRRAGSYSALAHEIDVLLLAMAHNALVWAEYRQRYQHKDQAA